jgi:hypothetical protein
LLFSMEFHMKTFAKLCAALIVAATWLFTSNAPAEAHRWRRQCHSYHHHHHWHRHCHCSRHHHHRKWRYSNWRKPSYSDGGSVSTGTVGSQCKARLEGVATGQGVFGLGSERARAAAIADFEAKAASLYGATYGSFSRARSPTWDCSKLAILRAKCIVTAHPCQ